MSGVSDWADNFLQGLSNSLNRGMPRGITPDPTAINPQSLSARTSGLPSVAANVVEGFGALHGAFMNATSALIQSMEHGAESGAAASAAGHTGAQWFQEFNNNMAQPASQAVKDMGDRAALKGDLGTLTGAFGRFVNNAGPIGDALFPVYRMGMALGSRMVEYSPAGLAGTAWDVARGLTGRGPYAAGLGSTPAGSAVGPLSERLTNNLLGTALSVWLAGKAMDGSVTGSGPTDPGEQAVWRANGIQPNSIRLPSGQYVSYDRMPPALRGPLIAAGAYADAQAAYNHAAAAQQGAGPQAYGLQDPREAAAYQLVSEVGRQLVSATPVRTFASLYDALSTGAGAGQAGLAGAGDIASSIAGGAVPESGLVRSIAQMTDPYQRQVISPRIAGELPQSIAQRVASNVPGAREQLPAQIDVLGRQVGNPLQGLGELSPLRPAAGLPSPILDMYQRAGVAPSAPPQTVDYGPYQQIQLKPQERQAWEQIQGRVLQQSLEGVANNPAFQRTDQQSLKQQQIVLNQIDAAASHVADMQMLGLIPNASARAVNKPGSITAAVAGYQPEISQQYNPMAMQLLTAPSSSSQLGATLRQRQAESDALLRSLTGIG
jgi:hypothetical protein